jgi:aryl-alcohol dehydrogenase-like predicted oxidoreductase
MNFGDSTDEKDGVRIIHAATDMGINFIDTADVYWHGESERIVGKAIGDRRSKVVVATKCWAPFDDGPNDMGSSRQHIMQAAEGALERLGTDYIDLFIMHRPDEALPALRDRPAPTEETLGALSDLVRQGKVRYIGTSCYPAWKIVESQLLSRHHGYERFCSDQLNYSIMNRYVERQVLRVCTKYGVGVTIFSPLQYGWMSGKYHRGIKPPADSRGARNFKMRLDAPDAARNFDIIEGLEPIAEARGITLSQLAISWLLTSRAVSSVISGPRLLEHLEDNVKSLEVSLDEEALAEIDTIAPPGSGPGADYNYPSRG